MVLSDRLWFVYLDWALEDIPRCFYVGKGDEKRVRKAKRNGAWHTISNEYGHRREIVFVTKSELEAYTYEETLTTHFKTYECWGANLTPGGNAVMSGRSHTPETREKCRIGSLGNKNSVGRKAGPETIAKISGPNHHAYGKPQPDAVVEKNRVANSGEKNAQAKLTREKVRSIRAKFVANEATKSELAKEHDVSRTLIHYIVIKKLWKETTND